MTNKLTFVMKRKQKDFIFQNNFLSNSFIICSLVWVVLFTSAEKTQSKSKFRWFEMDLLVFQNFFYMNKHIAVHISIKLPFICLLLHESVLFSLSFVKNSTGLIMLICFNLNKYFIICMTSANFSYRQNNSLKLYHIEILFWWCVYRVVELHFVVWQYLMNDDTPKSTISKENDIFNIFQGLFFNKLQSSKMLLKYTDHLHDNHEHLTQALLVFVTQEWTSEMVLNLFSKSIMWLMQENCISKCIILWGDCIVTALILACLF